MRRSGLSPLGWTAGPSARYEEGAPRTTGESPSGGIILHKVHNACILVV